MYCVPMSKNPQRTLGVFILAMLSVSAILNLRNIPIMASLGLQSIFFYAIATLFFLIPTALVSAELATKFPDNGGVYTWVKKALGDKVGFVAIWMEWFNNVIAFPATLATIVATMAFIGIPGLAENRFAIFAVMMLVFWGCTLFNLLNIKTSTKLNVVGALCGTIAPGALIIILGLIWVLSGQPLGVSWNDPMIPAFTPESLSLLVIAFSGYSGMQILAFHARNVKNPNYTFPRAILLGSVLILAISIFSALGVAMVISHDQLNIVQGVIASFQQFFDVFGLGFMTPILAICIVVGAIASLSAWMLGPARSLHVVAHEGYIPAVFKRDNGHGMPYAILFTQGIIGTLFASLYLFMPTVQDAFSLLVALTAQFTVMMFILIFISTIVLRYTHKQGEGYQIPGGKAVVWLVCGAGIIACAIAFIMGLFPSSSFAHQISTTQYITMMLIADVIIIGLPLIWIVWKSRKVIA